LKKSSELPLPVRRFILTSIPSVPYLEAALLLRAEPHAAWDAQGLARRLYLGEPQAAELLRALAGAGIAAPTANDHLWYRFAAQQGLRDLLDGLAQAYAADLVGVTDLIHSRTTKLAQQFADGFRWRKDN
jgi:hypothetical protein